MRPSPQRFWCFAVLSLLVPAVARAQTGTIAGSKHDFSVQSWNTSGQICIVCHTPHNANTTVTNAPLWNHASTVATFQTYASVTLNATVGQPDASSKLCLSCHDGTVALDSYGTQTGTQLMTGGALVGTDLRNDHPVSFTYDAALATADGGLRDPTTALSGIPGSTRTVNQDMLLGGKVQCASCHDVHNNGPTGATPLLVKSNSASGLCLTCHAK